MRRDPSLIGRYSRMRSLLMEEFKISRNPAEFVIAAMYKILDDEGKKVAPRAFDMVVQMTVSAFKLAEQQHSAGAMIAAATQLARLYGVGEPDRVEVTDGNAKEQAEIIEALKLTPAQRLQAINEARAKLEPAPPAETPPAREVDDGDE